MLERVLSWALALILSALLLAIALQSLLGQTPNPVFGLMALRSGIGLFDPVGRFAVSGLQILAVLMVLYPRSRAPGAFLALLSAAAAIVMHLTPWLGIRLPLADQATAAMAAGATAAQIAALPDDHGAMFLLALAIAVLSVAVVFVERAVIRGMAPRSRRPAGVFA